MITRKVKQEDTAKKMLAIATIMGCDASYRWDGARWFVVSFDCSPYQWIFINRRLQKEIKNN